MNFCSRVGWRFDWKCRVCKVNRFPRPTIVDYMSVTVLAFALLSSSLVELTCLCNGWMTLHEMGFNSCIYHLHSEQGDYCKRRCLSHKNGLELRHTQVKSVKPNRSNNQRALQHNADTRVRKRESRQRNQHDEFLGRCLGKQCPRCCESVNGVGSRLASKIGRRARRLVGALLAP
jgi:hypothetical protein